jgi:hypothetical protein
MTVPIMPQIGPSVRTMPATSHVISFVFLFIFDPQRRCSPAVARRVLSAVNGMVRRLVRCLVSSNLRGECGARPSVDKARYVARLVVEFWEEPVIGHANQCEFLNND